MGDPLDCSKSGNVQPDIRGPQLRIDQRMGAASTKLKENR